MCLYKYQPKFHAIVNKTSFKLLFKVTIQINILNSTTIIFVRMNLKSYSVSV